MGIGKVLEERRGVLALGADACCGNLEPGETGGESDEGTVDAGSTVS